MYYLVRVSWSQTDQDNYIILASSKKDAENKVRARIPGARYYEATNSATLLS